jgi:hypothetical protein
VNTWLNATDGAQQGSFHPGSGCTRMRDVFGEIGAAIDARQKNGRTHFHDLVDCEKRAQSVGVIWTAKCRLSISRTRTGMFMEIECEALDFSSSGTTTFSVNWRTIFSSKRMPVAWMPSSLMMRTRCFES